MAFNVYRLGRGFRAILAPLSAIVGFSCLLTFLFVLYQPTPGPGIQQRLGWQSWDVVDSTLPFADTDTSIDIGSGDDDVEAGDDMPAEDGVDWWNVTAPQDSVDSASLPLDVWAPLLPHDTGLSEIAVTQCFFNPKVAGKLCDPDTTPEKDAIRGNWVRVDRNLNYEASYLAGYLNIYYRRTRRQDIDLVTDLQLLGKGESPPEADDGTWHKVDMSLRTGVMRAAPLFLWYKTGKPAGQMSAEERANIITELDLLYGEDRPWYGFEKLEPPTTEASPRTIPAWLTYRRGAKAAPRAPPLHFSHSGKFKILQVADLHFSVSHGVCRDTDRGDCVHGDDTTLSLLDHVLDEERPDFIVFTGDQLNGQGTSWDPKSVLAKFARGVTDRNIPWAAVYGNHDEENGADKEEQMQMMKALPYSMVERGPKDVHGVGNYVLKAFSADASKTHLLTMYFLDSGSYSKGYFNWRGMFQPTAYDWIRQSQVDWFLQQSAKIKQILRPFAPDDSKDFGDVWRRQDQVTPSQRRIAKPNALVFFHIPLPETYNDPDKDPFTGLPLDKGESGNELPGNSKESDGFFEKAILGSLESDHTGKGSALEVKAIGNGHCHLTDNCRRVSGVWMCFGGGGSYSGYGRPGFDRRFRVYDISDFGETIRTYKRTEHDEIIDDMILAGKGAPEM
ncbi:Metallo-dependent phosphatase-like protein [Schizophyllum commune]